MEGFPRPDGHVKNKGGWAETIRGKTNKHFGGDKKKKGQWSHGQPNKNNKKRGSKKGDRITDHVGGKV